ncbi:MAG: hypothetical protein WC485_02975 [Opitutaceae bacterium]
MPHPAPQAAGSPAATALALIFAGAVLVAGAWTLPVNLKSINPALLREAGLGTPSLADFGLQLLESEKPGPAALVLAAAQTVGDPHASRLAEALAAFATRQREFVAWGGWDPFLDPLFNLKENTGRTESTPVLTFFITEHARDSLRRYLANSRSPGVQTVLQTRDVPRTARFVPAARPGGQPLDAVVLLTALLYQGEHLSPSLQREVKRLADEAVRTHELGELEPFYLDLLALGRRLNWIQLGELLRLTDNTKTVSEFAHLAQVAPDQLPLLYAGALFSRSADSAAGYLLLYGKAGAADLRFALGYGQGAVQQLLLRQVPVNHGLAAPLDLMGAFALLHPRISLIAKYLGYFLGAFLILRGLDRWLFAPLRRVAQSAADSRVLPRIQSSAMALLIAFVIIITTEPFLLKAAPPSEYRFKLVIPVLANIATPAVSNSTKNHPTMDTSTIVSIGVFALLQVATYLACLLKIGEVDRQDLPPLLKLRLMENEENLFDSGLYVGMMGTAAALVLQVLGVIEPNLLAAYSSNLFGIVCVAFVKIRHVRGYKRRLILAAQGPVAPAAQPAPVAS